MTGNTALEASTDQPQGPQNGVNHDRMPNQKDLDKTVQLDPYWPQSEESIGKRVIHKDLTLDQYYYESLQDTNTRDCSQVLGRLFDRESPKTDNKGDRAGQSGQSGDTKDKLKAQILTVNQLWLWILDDGMPYISYLLANFLY